MHDRDHRSGLDKQTRLDMLVMLDKGKGREWQHSAYNKYMDQH